MVISIPRGHVSEQANGGWDAAKIGAGVAALAGAIRYFFKARTTNAHDRIKHLERQVLQLREDLSDIPTLVESINSRMRHQEVSLNDLKREVRDSLNEIEDTVRRGLRRFDAE